MIFRNSQLFPYLGDVLFCFWMLLWLLNGIAGIRRSQPLSGVRLIKDGVSCVKKQTSRLYKGTVPLLIAWSCDITCLQRPFNVFVLLYLGAAGVLSLTHFQGFLASRIEKAWGHAFWEATVWRMKVVGNLTSPIGLGSPQGLQFCCFPGICLHAACPRLVFAQALARSTSLEKHIQKLSLGWKSPK